MANYEIRNVAEKEIYDSYMGIMRISPNPSNISNSNSKLIDDPTELLNSIVNAKKGTQTEITLSDSDGNVLPIIFIPKAKNTTVMIEGVEKTIPLINIVTKIDDGAKLYIEENFKSYNTVWIDNNKENEEDKKISPLQILTKSGINENILLYPVDSPNDSSYFNDKNRFNLVNRGISINKRDQLNISLQEKKYDWYTSNFEKEANEGQGQDKDKLYAEDNYVSLNGKYVTTFNKDGELVPVLYTKDYVLGHYDGHSLNLNENNVSEIKSNWIGSESRLYENSSLKGATKLSWIRFDNLVWDVIGSVLRGDLRHTKGRYTGLGSEETDNVDVLFEGGNCTLHNGVDSGSDWMEKTAPMLGQGVQKGLIIYNAMPFSRYMFHVARQTCTNMLYQFGCEGATPSKIKFSDWKSSYKTNFNNIANVLQMALASEKITPATKGTFSSPQSISKDFLLCDGKEIKYENYPNINISNRELFEIDKNKFYPNPTNKKFEEKSISSESSSNVYEAMRNSNIEKKFETPHLYVLNEDAPRFLRGLNWSLDENDFDKYEGQEEVVSFNNVKNNYGRFKNENVDTVNISVDVKNLKEGEEDLRITQNKFKYTANAKKNIKDVGLYFHNYDLKIKRNEHYHAEFSAENGMHSSNDVTTPYETINKTECIGYHSGRKRGGEYYTANHESVLNHDKTNTLTTGQPYDYSPEWITYCFGYHNKYDGYAPIPNGGLYLFNRTLYNGLETTGTYYGTTKDIENQIKNNVFGYIDGENNRHEFIPIESVVDIHNKFVEELRKKGININDYYKYLEGDSISLKRDKHHQVVVNARAAGLSSSEISECYRAAFESHNIAKEQRRIMLTKINESEGRIPASARGGPYYRSGVTWSREERRGLKKKRRKAYSYFWTGVGSYKISTNIEVNADNNHYRCITSLPFGDRRKLGVGDLTKTLETDWYSKNSITTPVSEIVYPETSYSGKTINKMQNGLPTPEYINLLPLIRI